MPFWIIIVILGLVEGLTEFLPISSTGHLIITNELLGFSERLNSKDLANIFEVVIQLGAIFAVGLLYREKLIRAFWSPVVYLQAVLRRKKDGNHHKGDAELEREPLLAGDRMLFFNIMLGTIPAVIVGFLTKDLIEEYLFNSLTVSITLILGGIAIFIIEARPQRPTATSTASMSPMQALTVGLVQVLSLIPGTSRSGATIMGGLCAKMSRPVATEFSFLLSFPIMCMATAYTLLKDYKLITLNYILILILGTVVAFLSAYVVVKWLIRFVQTHSFRIFAWYRIALGLVVLALHFTGFFQHIKPSAETAPAVPEAAQ